jgi:hypothetical protein
MDHRVEKTFRKVQGTRASHASSSTFLQSMDAATRNGVVQVGCVCGPMNSCPFLLLCLQGTDDVEMDDVETDDVETDYVFNEKGL